MAKSVCIIGAGPSGIVAAKSLLYNATPGSFRVSVFDAQHDIGGLWPMSKTENGRQVHPLMVANQSKHTMHFSELPWESSVPQFPLAWQVGQYLKRYTDHYLSKNDHFELFTNTKVVSAVPKAADGSKGWNVTVRGEQGEQNKAFDLMLVATGFFGKPIIPECLKGPAEVPIVHSSAYRDLQSLLGKGNPNGGKILVVGGQMSGVEIAGTIASHLSSAANAPDACGIEGIGNYTVHNVIQRPIWVFPLYTSPEPSCTAAPFLPLDFASYNLNNRPGRLVNTQGHISQETANTIHGIFQNVVGGDQSAFSEHLKVTDEERVNPPYLAVSDWYSDFVRSGLISLSKGKLESLEGTTASLSPNGEKVENVAAVVVATGFDASPCLDFLPKDVLEKLHHAPQHVDQSVALAFHGTHHPDVSGLGFVGFYRSPYWGVMQMQARYLAKQWSQDKLNDNQSTWSKKLDEDISVQRTLSLREDARCSQFPMGDYPFLMQELAEALGMEISEPLTKDLPTLSHNGQPLNVLTPARYVHPDDDEEAKNNAGKLLEETRQVALDGLTSPRFVARAVFRSLLGTWKLERDLTSKLPSHPSGHFSGTAKFLLRQKTRDGLQCLSNGQTPIETSDEEGGLEYLYIEEGEFNTDSGFGFQATRRYVWRYDEARDALSVWFVKPEDEKRADYLFHEIEFEQPEDRRNAKGWLAKAGHLCVDDFYDVKYNFAFKAVNLRHWGIEYTVKGPKKDYTIRGTYTR